MFGGWVERDEILGRVGVGGYEIGGREVEICEGRGKNNM